MIKANKGITLISIIIYITATLIFVGIIAKISSVFYSNMQYIEQANVSSQITKLNQMMVEEVNQKGNKIISYGENYLLFSNGNKYTFQDKGIYKASAKICKDITKCIFQVVSEGEKQIITIQISTLEDMQTEKTISYTITN